MVDIPCVFILFYQKFTNSEILQTLALTTDTKGGFKI
jgi:hypothetical protein